MKNKHSNFKSIVQSKARWLFTLFALLTLGVGQMWATDYYYRGDRNSWDATKMTPSEDGLYCYYTCSAGEAHQFKIALSTTGYDYNYSYVQKGFNGGSNDIGDYGSNNCYCWISGAHYIIVYYPNMYAFNTGNDPIICAATSLPKHDWYIKHDWGGSGWSWQTLSKPGSGSNYTYEGQWGTDGCNINTSNADGNAGWIAQASIAGQGTFSDGDNVIFTYNPTTNSLSVSDKTYSVSVVSGGHGTVSTSSVTAGKYTTSASVTATPSTCYHFVNWTATSGVTITSPSNTSTTVKATGASKTLTANFAATSYTITFLKNGGSDDGSATATYDNGTLTSVSHATRGGGYTLLGYYTASSAGTKVVNNDGTLVADIAGYTDEDGNWVRASNTDLYAQWAAGSTLTVIAGTGISSVTGDVNPVTLGTKYDISASVASGYTFNTWTASPAGNGAFDAAGSASTKVQVNNGSVTVTASATEDKVTLTPTVSYDHGSSNYTASSSNTVGVTTTTDLSCSAPNAAHYTFAGWTLTNLTVTSGNEASDRSITVKVTTPGSPISAVANYNEVLTQSTYKFKGGTGITGYNWAEAYSMNKKSGYSTSDEVYYTANIASTNTSSDQVNDYGFMIDINGTLYGLAADGDSYWWTRSTSGAQTLTTSGKNIQIRADVAGSYEIKVDYSTPTAPTVLVTFPTSYTVNFGVSPTGAASAPTNDKSLSNGGLVLSGTSVTFTHGDANTGYTWSHWEKDGVNVGTSNTYTTTIGTATTMTAVYTENSYATTVSATNGSVSPASPNISHHTGTALTATPNTNYVFESWSVTGGGLAVKDGSSLTSNPATFTATSTGGTITANFADQWSVCGIPNFSTWNGLPLKSGTVYEGTIHLTAGNYTFKVVDRKTNTWYTEPGKTITRAANTASATTTTGTDNNITITADKEGDYTFTFDTGDKSLTVTYPVDPTYTVTVTAGTHGSITTPAAPATTVSAGEFTPATIVAQVDDYGYFQGWTVVSGSATIADASNLNTTVTATSAATIKANFVSHWTIAGGDSEESNGTDAMGDWSTVINGIDNFEEIESGVWQGYVDIVLPANTTFYFKVRDLYDRSAWYGNTGEMTYGNSTNWLMTKGSSNCRITTAGAGKYRFTWNETTLHLTVTYPDSYTVTYGKVADNGQDIGGVTVTGDDGATLESGKYVAKGSATFTAAAATNYTFIDWRTSATYGEGTQLSTDNPYTMTSIAENKTVYAHYAENMTTVNLSATNGKIQYWDGDSWEDAASSVNVGVATNCSIKAVPATGYYFSGWVNTEGSDYEITGSFNVEDNNNTTLKGKGVGETTGQTLTANFVELDKIYFRNIFDDGEGNVSRWSDVYAYFNYSLDGDKVHTNSNAAYKVAMTRIGSTDVYYGYVPRAITTSGNKKVAFSDTEFTADYTFYNVTESGSKGAARSDYSPLLNMFVPNHTPNQTNNNGVDYYSNGYWMKYDTRASQGAGYYLKVYNSRNNYTQKGEFTADTDDATIIQYQVRIDNVDEENTRFMITSAGGLNYIADETVTSASGAVEVSENLNTLTDNDVYFQLTATSEGYYTFIIDQSGDKMKLMVDYPAAVGDYRLVYTNTALGGKIRTTDIIKNRNKAGYVTTMFIDKDAEGAVLKLQKCTAISDLKPVWTDAGGSGASALLSAFAGKDANVYKFTIDIVDDAANNVATSATCSIDAIEVYNGPFYIKTDCANGGWASFTANEMEENTVNYDGTDNTYNYYYCKWVDGITESFKMNMKFVIATDYNNAVSDTISETPEETFLVSNGYKKELLPENANVRFSFNTKTGTAKRAYILGSTALETFIWLQPNAEGNVYDYVKGGNGSTDMYYEDDANRKFKDNGNWTYQMDVELTPNAKAGVKVRYPSWSSSTTYLVPQTTELIGHSNDGQYDFRLVYDFKTNHLIAAWIAGGINQNLTLDANVLMIREAQDASKTNVIILNNNSTIHNTDTAYGAIEFKRDAMVGQLNTLEKIYEQCLYYISFPFDVKVSDVIGIGKRGVDWNLYKYNGTKRAEVGWFLGDGHETFWETMSGDDVMHAYEGYCLGLEETHFNDGANAVWTNISAGGSTFIYFPSSTSIGDIHTSTKTITVPVHICEIDQYYKQDKENYPNNPEKWRNHKITDSNWNVIGSPLFANGTMKSFVVNAEVDEDRQLKYYYAWDHTTGNWSPLTNNADWMITEHGTEMTNNEQTFNAMFGYFVQFAGTVTFEGAMQKEESVVARRKAAPQNYAMSLELSRGGKKENRAFVELREGANDDFMLDEDMCLMASSNADIYTYAGAYDAMANVLSMDDHMVRVGVDIKTAGEYTFSMPVMFDGTAVLVDLLTGTRTNLALSDYTVSLNKGMYNDRFVLEIGARKIVTSLDTTDLKDGNVHKFVENGVMYILRDGKRYDAQGKVVNN